MLANINRKPNWSFNLFLNKKRRITAPQANIILITYEYIKSLVSIDSTKKLLTKRWTKNANVAAVAMVKQLTISFWGVKDLVSLFVAIPRTKK
jgi:hypothetical protein